MAVLIAYLDALAYMLRPLWSIVVAVLLTWCACSLTFSASRIRKQLERLNDTLEARHAAGL